MFSKKKDKKDINSSISSFVKKVFEFYLTVDNSIVINSKKLNLRNEEIKKASLDYDVSFYFDFFNAISEYREKLKQNIASSEINSLLQSSEKGFTIESRIKNINSIFSKIYQYINHKKEKGSVAINKCLNDLFGLRIILSCKNLKELFEILKELSEENGWKFKIINASKAEYRAIHLYMSTDNYSLPWEIQFWLSKDDATNRESHAKYKQSYTSWELSYSNKDLYEVCE